MLVLVFVTMVSSISIQDAENCTNETVIVEHQYAAYRPSWYIFHPLDQTVYLVLACLCIAIAVLNVFLMLLHVTLVSKRICVTAWDQVVERTIGSEDEHEEYLEDVDKRGIGKKPIFDWGTQGFANPYVYDLKRLYSKDMMDIDDQRAVHLSPFQALYLSRGRGYMYIGFTLMILASTVMNLLGYLMFPDQGEDSPLLPENMEFPLISVFIPQTLMMLFALLFLAFHNGYRNHHLALHMVFVVGLCFTFPQAVMDITRTPHRMNIMMVAMDWMIVLMSLRHAVWFPVVSGRGDLKKHMRHYIRANKHAKNLDVTERSFILQRKQKIEYKNKKRQQLVLPVHVHI